MSIPRLPERPSFAQRDAYRDVLSDGYAQGRLGDEDFAARLELAHDATTLRDLEGLIADLPRGGLPVPRPSGGTGPVTGGETTRRWPIAVVVGGVLLVSSLAGAGMGVATGSSALRAQESAAEADVTEVDEGDGTAPEALDYQDIARGVAFTAQQDDPTSVSFRTHAVLLDVPTAGGTAYDEMTLHADGSESSTPGGMYDDEGAPPSVEADSLDVDVLAAIVLAAPAVYEEHTGARGLPTNRVEVDADHVHEGYAGVEREEPVVTAWLATDEYGGGGGRVVWTLEGSRVLEVME